MQSEKNLSTSSLAKTGKNPTRSEPLFHIHALMEPARALALAPRITDPETRFSVLLHAVNSDPTKTSSAKIEAYHRLLKEFPDRQEILEFTAPLRNRWVKMSPLRTPLPLPKPPSSREGAWETAMAGFSGMRPTGEWSVHMGILDKIGYFHCETSGQDRPKWLKSPTDSGEEANLSGRF